MSRDSSTRHRVDDFFFFRSTLLPFDMFVRWGDDLKAVHASEAEDLSDVIHTDVAALREKLREIVQSVEVREAIFVSSPSLYAEIAKWMAEPDSEYGRKIEIALVKYFARMTGRPTPFGLMSGCSIGSVGSTTEVQLQPRGRYRRRTRLDHDYVFTLSSVLDADPALRADLHYTANSTLYRVADRFRYVETRQSNGRREYRFVSVVATDYLERVLEVARQPATIDVLTQLLSTEFDVAADEARDFVGELIDEQLLVSDLTPLLSGVTAAADVVGHLRELRNGAQYAVPLSHALETLRELDERGVGNGAERYRSIADALAQLPVQPEPSRLFQVDMIKPVETATIDAAVADEILAAADVVTYFSRARSDEMRTFAERFLERFGDAEVPLTTALDPETGIGFPTRRSDQAAPSGLLERIGMTSAAEKQRPRHRAESLLIRKWSEAVRTGAREVIITEDDLPAKEQRERLPPLIGAVAALVDPSAETDYAAVLHTILGQSAASLLGRFCHCDETFARNIAQHLAKEERSTPGVIFAEVVHLPEERVANVLARPLLRDYEIPYLARSGAPREHQILVSDLRVSVDPREGVVLRSQRFGKRVIPRMANVYNFRLQGNLPIFRFLGELEEQITGPIWSWSWGPLESATVLPRVRYGRILLAPAFWNLSRDHIAPLAQTSRAKRFQAVQRLRGDLALPRFLYVADRDNTLPVDLDNVLSVESLIALLRNRSEAMLLEIIPSPQASPVKGPEGRFVHDVVIPYVADRAVAAAVPAARDVQGIERSFAPGSEWLYAKLYTGLAHADHALTSIVGPLAERWTESGLIDKWFFLRYYDPDFHLRIRFHGLPQTLSGPVLGELHAATSGYVKASELHRIQLDTYNREIERYGGSAAIELCESLFHADSVAAIKLLTHYAGDAGHDLRWRVAMLGADMIFDDLEVDLPTRHGVTGRLFKSAAAELHVGPPMRARLGAVFRAERDALSLLRERRVDADRALAPALAILHERSRNATRSARELLRREKDLTASLADIVASLAHMHINRLLSDNHRAHEAAVYFFLHKLYDAEIARSRTTEWRRAQMQL